MVELQLGWAEATPLTPQIQENLNTALDTSENLGAKLGQGIGNMMGGLEVPDTQQVPMSAPEDWEDLGNDQKERSERHLRPVLELGLAAVDQGMARAQPIVRSAEETAQQFVKCASPFPSPHA